MKKIAVIGSMNMDYVLNVPHMPKAGETLLCKSFENLPGGKGANQACAVGKLGGNAVMLGAVGADGAGEALCKSLASAGVEVSRVLRLPDLPTGSAFIQVNGEGENCIVVAQGANRAVDIPYLERNRDVLEDCEIWVFQLEIPLETVVYGAKLGRSLGKTVVLDPAPARTDLPPELFPCLDYLKPNQGEAALLAGIPEGDPARAARILRDKGAGNVLITLGPQGAYLLDREGKESRYPADTSVTVVDTTGAGDCFTAAFARGLAAGETAEDAARFAIRASGLAVTRKGAQPSMPTWEETEGRSFGKEFKK